MKKTFAIVYVIICLQLLSVKVGSSTATCKLLSAFPKYAAAQMPQRQAHSPAYTIAAQCDSITDIDGNVYHLVKIGNQCWTQENLKTTRFNDGSPIGELEYASDWPNTGYRGSRAETGIPAWCYYERNNQYNNPYGKLYNWYAVADPRNICPAGWHVATDEDYQLLSDTLGGDAVAGGHMKTINLWNENDEKNANNSSGFTALPAGIRYRGGSFDRAGADGADFWTSSNSSDGHNLAICRSLYYGGANLGRHNLDKRSGLSVRCVGD